MHFDRQTAYIFHALGDIDWQKRLLLAERYYISAAKLYVIFKKVNTIPFIIYYKAKMIKWKSVLKKNL